MEFAKNVVVSIGTAEDGVGAQAFGALSQMTFLNHSTIHFVHVFKTMLYSSGLTPNLLYPAPEERTEIEESVFQYLKRTFAPIVPSGFEGQAHFKCLFSEAPKEAILKYVDAMSADLVILASRKERGFFESSFAEYVSKHTVADVLILKMGREDLIGR